MAGTLPHHVFLKGKSDLAGRTDGLSRKALLGKQSLQRFDGTVAPEGVSLAGWQFPFSLSNIESGLRIVRDPWFDPESTRAYTGVDSGFFVLIKSGEIVTPPSHSG